MSSLRNAVQRRNHKERAQPHSRQKWGILEKHRDYSLRAKDHNAKKRKIQDLRARAAGRNDDEFYFGMVSIQNVSGQKAGDRQHRSLDHQEVTGLKRQDAVYLRSMLQVTRKEIARIEDEIQLLERGPEGAEIVTLRKQASQKSSGGHTVFVEDSETQQSFRAEAWFAANEDDLGRIFNRARITTQPIHRDPDDIERKSSFSSKRQMVEEEKTHQAKREEKRRLRSQEARKRRIALLRTQEQELMAEEQHLESQRAKMAGTSPGGVNKKGQAFKIRERKR